MEATVDNALEITQKAAYRLFYKKYRGCLKNWDEFFSDAQFLVFEKFAQFDPKIGTFEGYINMYVEFAAVRILSTRKRQNDRGVTHIGTIEDVTVVENDVPEELDFVVRRAVEIAQEPGMKRCDSVRRRLKEELRDLGWTASQIATAFREIVDAIGSSRLRAYAKTEEA